MTSKASTPEEYLAGLPEDHKEAVTKLRNTIIKNLPEGFKEVVAYGMLGYVVPHEIYPPGYHCDPKLPLGFVSVASQKTFISLHHMGIYGDPGLLKWFTDEYPKHTTARLDMGKSCVRFKKPEHIPYDLIGELMKKISVEKWIASYEKNMNR